LGKILFFIAICIEMVENVYEHARARQSDLAYVKELTFAVILHREAPAAIRDSIPYD
jgi:hypothetical protein